MQPDQTIYKHAVIKDAITIWRCNAHMIRMLSAPCLDEIILPMLTHEALNPSILILENIISCHSDKLVCGLILECTPYVFLRVCHNCHHDKLACGPKGEIIILIISYCLCRVFCLVSNETDCMRLINSILGYVHCLFNQLETIRLICPLIFFILVFVMSVLES